MIDDIDWIECLHTETILPDSESVAYKINHNVRTGLQLAFDVRQSDHALLVEDDVLLGYDCLVFSQSMHEKYDHMDRFRGVNAFSKEPLSKDRFFSYGTFRYGIGQGWSISAKIWQQLKPFWPSGSMQHFDALVEPWFRNGFVVMPYCSRSCNIGFGGSAHSPMDESDEYYVTMRASWVGNDPFKLQPYVLNNELAYTWRADCITFKHLDIVEQLTYYKWRLKRICKILINYLFP